MTGKEHTDWSGRIPTCLRRSYGLSVYSCLYTWLLQIFVLGVMHIYGDYLFFLAALFVLALVVVGLMFLLRDDLERVLYCFGVFLVSPQISVEFSDLGNFPYDVFRNFFLHTDRFNVGIFTSIILSIALFLRSAFGGYLVKSRVGMMSMVALFVAILVFMFRFGGYDRLSIYQVIVEYALLVGAISWFTILVQLPLADIRVLWCIEKVLLVFLFVAGIDVLVSISGYVPWSRSYRGTMQGAIFGNEVYFSLIVGLAIVGVVAVRSLPGLVKTILIAAGLIILYGTAVKSSYYSLLLVAAFSVMSRIEMHQYKALILGGSVFLIVGLSWLFSNLDVYFYFISLWARLGTVIAGALVYVDENIIFGIGPGVLDHSMLGNLAIFIFDGGYADFIYNLGLPVTAVAEILERSEYSAGGEFSPHMAPAALFFSHGLWVLPFVIYYYFLVPIRIVRSLPHVFGKIEKVLSLMYLYLVIFGFFHPILPIFLMMFLAMVLSKSGTLSKGEMTIKKDEALQEY